MPNICPVAVSAPSLKYLVAVAAKGMLSAENKSTLTNAPSTICNTKSAEESKRCAWRKLRAAITVQNRLISHAQKSSEPSRPAQSPDNL